MSRPVYGDPRKDEKIRAVTDAILSLAHNDFKNGSAKVLRKYLYAIEHSHAPAAYFLNIRTSQALGGKTQDKLRRP